MSKRKHRSRTARENNNVINNGTYNNGNNNPFGINPAQLLSLLGGGDMSQLGSMLNTMGRDGFDLSVLGNMFPNMNNIGQSNNVGAQNSFSGNNFDSSNNNTNESRYENGYTKVDDNRNNIEDDNIEFLKSLRVIADPKRREFIDQIIAKYLDGDFDD